MTNASAKNTFAGLSLMVGVFALFVGAFASTAYADVLDNGGWFSGVSPSFNDVQPIGGSYDVQPIGSNYDVQPIGTNYDVQPIGSSYDVQPIGSNYDVQPIGTNYDVQPIGSNYTSPIYSVQTPYYSTYCGCYSSTYGSSAMYGSSYIPTYTPIYSYTQPFTYSYTQPQIVRQPIRQNTPTTVSTPTSQNQNQTQYSYVNTPNTNVNTNSTGPIKNTNTSSSNPYTYSYLQSNPYTTSDSKASTGPISNTNSTGPSYSYSSTGPVTSTNTNTNNPVAHATATGGNATNGPISINNTVNVAQAQPQQLAQYTFPRPYCTISASGGYSYNYSNYNNYNQPITLTWSSSNATSAYITPQVGTVNPNGSQTVYPQGYTTYTLTISGPGGTATCQTTANYASNYVTPTYAAPTYVAPTYVAPAVYTQPAAPAVSLTQIPYTGFDYGPLGNAIYWMSLLAFAAAAGYLLVYFRGGAFAFASSMVGRKRNDSYDFENNEEAVSEASVSAPVITLADVPVQEESKQSAALPTIENRRMTVDSMIIERSAGGAPRIVIARA